MLLFFSVNSIDVSWVPNDPDSSLPLSKNYRASLRKLCKIIEENSKVATNLLAEKPSLKKMCIRLKRDDKNIESSTYVPPSKLILTIFGIGGGSYLAWLQRYAIKKIFNKIFVNWRGHATKLDKVDANTYENIRAARIRHFASLERDE